MLFSTELPGFYLRKVNFRMLNEFNDFKCRKLIKYTVYEMVRWMVIHESKNTFCIG